MSTERVVKVAVCLHCQTRVGVPAYVHAGAELTCPRCEKRFTASPGVVQELPMAVVAGAIASEHHEDAEEHDDAVISGLHFDLPTKPVSGDHRLDVAPAVRAPRRRASPLATVVGIVGGGAVGLLLAGYALLWITDPPLDLFRMARWLPDAVLPAAAVQGNGGGDLPADDADF